MLNDIDQSDTSNIIIPDLNACSIILKATKEVTGREGGSVPEVIEVMMYLLFSPANIRTS